MASKSQELDSYEEMKEAFHLFDKDNDGIITCGELQKLFVHIGCEITLDECDLMIKEVDETGRGGGIEFEDFVKLMKMSKEELAEGFNHIHDYEDVRLALEDLKKEFHQSNSEEQKVLQQRIKECQHELFLRKQQRDKQVYKGKHTRKM